MAIQDETKTNLKKLLKGALIVGGAYAAVKNPEGALEVIGGKDGLIERDMAERQRRIEERGKHLAETQDYLRQRADLLYANKMTQYQTDYDATKKLDDSLQSLVSASATNGASKQNIAMNVLVAKGIIPSTGTEIEPNSGIDIQLKNEMSKIKDVTDKDGKVTGYSYEGSNLPVMPDYKTYYDPTAFQNAQELIQEGAKGTLSEKLFGMEDTGADAVAKLEADINAGYQKILSDDVSGGKKNYEFKAAASGTGEFLTGFTEQGLPVHPNLTTTDLSTLNSNWKSIQSKSTYAITTGVMGAVIPGDQIKDIVTKDSKGEITVRPDGQSLFNDINGLQVIIATRLYDQAKYVTGNMTDLNESDVKKHVTNEFIARKILVDTDQALYDFENPIKGFYVIPTSIVPLGERVPATTRSLETGQEVNTMEYLSQELNKIAEKYESQEETLEAAKGEMNAFVRDTLNPAAPTFEFESNGFTIISPSGKPNFNSWESLSLEIARVGEAEFAKSTPSEVVAKYYEWVKQRQENRPSTMREKEGPPPQEGERPSIDNQVNELLDTGDVGDISLNNFLEFAPPFKTGLDGKPTYSRHRVGNTIVDGREKLTQEFIDWSKSDGAQAWIDFIQNYAEPVGDNYETSKEFEEARKEYNSSIRNFKGKNSKKINEVIERRNQVLGTE